MVSVILIGLPIYSLTGQYKGLPAMSSLALYRLAARNGLLVLLLIGIGLTNSLPMPPQQLDFAVVIAHWFTGARGSLRDVLLNLRSFQHKQQLRVAIIVPASWHQLTASLRLAGNHKIVTFIDDNPSYWSRSINGVDIQPPRS